MWLFVCVFFFCKKKTAYELRISDWSSDVCSSDLARVDRRIASRKFAIVQEEDQRVPRFGAADQAKARHQAVSLVCEWRAPQSRPNSLASRRAPACSSRGAAASPATAAPPPSTSIRPRSAASLMSNLADIGSNACREREWNNV